MSLLKVYKRCENTHTEDYSLCNVILYTNKVIR